MARHQRRSRGADSGGYWYHQPRGQPHPAVHDTRFHERLLATLARATGTGLP
ncbi:hypothetical protein VSR17_08395 [Cupriavidus taiwanensis]|uniref:hypothetical protein n=1 Tax=Cupriavidus taiwanensis TaxID=164546 RepID=UPI001F120DC9|nr:hypothetical protein [Cupriavidus taiwanensis]